MTENVDIVDGSRTCLLSLVRCRCVV
jgi:hypothetical protein